MTEPSGQLVAGVRTRGRRAGRVRPGLSAEQAAAAPGIPEHLRAAFVQITERLRVGAAGTAPETGADGRARP
ncbi:hypothetical protein QQY24_14740 [Streptomyces sp. TG1A-8]|uniref:hypothetical protein n=1 Tax=Streptomyces sp. TG1A-8 TaxID=3051385 RepID=UPI00265BBAFB|nr:hypothetical protein [Streptomyces sp. TG1A-8]MDO0926608.1 hypothetical protein [Streptomyces sp. TG1A-8]